MTAAVATALTIDYGHVELLPVHFDDLDPMGMIHNARHALLIERAVATFWRHHGHTFSDGRPTTADAFNVVKESTICYRAPIRGPGDVVVHFCPSTWVGPVRCTPSVFSLPTAQPSSPKVAES
jgi:acyl-CoA thioester hydrolase